MATPASETIRQKPRATTADELAVIAQRAQSFTNASGAAIAISDGSADEIVCRARSGSSAPDVGTALRVEGTFTGFCIQSGKELRCDDAETDTRVDTSAIRALGIRSMVVTPIRDDGRVAGVLAVFAPTPHAFTITHVAVLKTMADQIAALLQRERRTKDEPHREAQIPAAPPAPVPAPVAISKPHVTPVPLPTPIVLKPVAGPPAATAAAAVPVRQPSVPPPSPPPVPAAPRMDTHPVALAADISVPAPFPKKEVRREFAPEPVVAKASFGTLDAVAGEPAKSPAGKLMLIGAIVLIAVGAVLGWMYFRSHKASPQAQPQTQTQPQPQAPAPVASAPAAVATNSAPASNPATPAASTSTTASSGKADISDKSESKKAESKKKEAQPAPAPAPPAPTTIALGSGPSKIAQPTPQAQTEDVSPTLGVGGGSSSGLASLARPVGSSTPQMVAQSDLVNAKAIHTVPAVYPELAKNRRINGTVVVKVLVGKDGKVSNPQFISGPMIFRDAAFDAVKQWTFKPATLNGKTIDQETEIKVIFHP